MLRSYAGAVRPIWVAGFHLRCRNQSEPEIMHRAALVCHIGPKPARELNPTSGAFHFGSLVARPNSRQKPDMRREDPLQVRIPRRLTDWLRFRASTGHMAQSFETTAGLRWIRSPRAGGTMVVTAEEYFRQLTHTIRMVAAMGIDR